MSEAIQVRYKTSALTVYPWHHTSGKEYWRFRRQDGKITTRATLEKAKECAKIHAQEIHNGSLDLTTLTPDQVRKIQRMLESDPSLAHVDEYLVWMKTRMPKKQVRIAVAEFLAIKEKNAGRSRYNLEILKRHLKHMPDCYLSEVTPANLPSLNGAPRTQKNAVNAWRTFFTWCRKMGYFAKDDQLPSERIETPQVQRKTPTTYTPAQLQIMIANVTPSYLPWLLLASWAGLRSEECCKDHKSKKDSIRWEDFEWDRDLLIIREEVSKVGKRRIVPILPCLKTMLKPLAGTGLVCPHLPPHTPAKGGVMSETTRLGKTIGGWKKNALRHSFISYRAAAVGITQAANEAGNSEAVSRASYQDAKGADEALAWFSAPIAAKSV